MARDHLIDSYVDSLRHRLSWRSNADDIVAEIRDHLESSTERLVDAGVDRDDALRQTLDRFGEPATVAVSFAATGSRGLAVPTGFTQSAGVMSVIAGVAWLLVPATWFVAFLIEHRTGTWEGRAQAFWTIGAAGLLAAGAVTTVIMAALHQRHGGLGVIGAIGVGLCALGAAAGLIGWFVYGWGLLLGVGVLLLTAAVRRRGLAPRLPTALLGSAAPLAWAVGATLWTFEVGPRDEWGDYQLALVIGIAVGSVVATAGLVGIGRWLHHEDPIDDAVIRLASST